MRHKLLTAALLASALAVPAAHADDTEYVGFGCGYTIERDSTNASGRSTTGVVSAGEWLAFDALDDDTGRPGEPALTDIEIHCVFQADETARPPGTAGHDGVLSHHARGTGFVYRERNVRLFVPHGESMFLCTYVVMRHHDRTEMVVFDRDGDPANGAQCWVYDQTPKWSVV